MVSVKSPPGFGAWVRLRKWRVALEIDCGNSEADVRIAWFRNSDRLLSARSGRSSGTKNPALGGALDFIDSA